MSGKVIANNCELNFSNKNKSGQFSYIAEISRFSPSPPWGEREFSGLTIIVIGSRSVFKRLPKLSPLAILLPDTTGARGDFTNSLKSP